jgi:V/A-type H+/Na+-transporting ATPase subunit C
MIGVMYSAVNAKVRYWLSMLLTPDKTRFLIDGSIADVIDYIRRNEPKTVIESDDILYIEGQVKQAVIEYIKSGMRYITGSTYGFLQDWLKSYEIENLKIITRSIMGEKNIDFLYEVRYNDRIRMETVKEINSLDMLKEFLRHTEYYRLADEAFPRIKDEGNTFYWEMELDNYYARKLKESTDRLAATDKKAVVDLVFYGLEMKRLLWLYRVRYHYNMSVAEAVTLIPNTLHVLSKTRYKRLASMHSPAEFLQAIKDWGIISETVETITALEQTMNKSLRDKISKYLRGSPFSFGVFLAFIMLKQLNIKTFIILLEGKRNHIDKESLERMVGI